MLIGEVADLTGVSARMLRHYDQLGLARPSLRTSAGYRDYSHEDVRRILRVEALRSIGLSLTAVGDLLAGGDADVRSGVDELIGQTRQRIRQDRELLRRLRLVRAADPDSTSELLDILGTLRQLTSDDPSTRQRVALLPQDPPSGSALTDSLLREKNDNVAGALLWALEQSGAVDLDMIRRGLAAQSPGVRLRAVEILERMHGASGEDMLEELVDDADQVISTRAVLALGRRARTDMLPRLLEMILDGDHDVEAAEVLGELPGATAENVAPLLATPGRPPEQRLRLAQALAEIPGSADLLAELTHDEDPVVARTARHILGGNV